MCSGWVEMLVMSSLVYNITYLAWNITVARHVPVTIVHDVSVDLLRQRLEGGDVEGGWVNDVDLWERIKDKR